MSIDFSRETCVGMSPVLIVDIAASVKSLTIVGKSSTPCYTVVHVQQPLTANTITLTGKAWLHFESAASMVSCNVFTSNGATISGFGKVVASNRISLANSDLQPGQNGGPFLGLNVTFGASRVVQIQNYTLCQRCYSPFQARTGIILGDLTFASPVTALNTSTIRARFLSTLRPSTQLPSGKTTPVDRVIFASNLTTGGKTLIYTYYNQMSEVNASVRFVTWETLSGDGTFALTQVVGIGPYKPHMNCSDQVCRDNCTQDCSGEFFTPATCKRALPDPGIGTCTIGGGGPTPPDPQLGGESEGGLCGFGGLSVLVGVCPSQQSGVSLQPIAPGTTSGTATGSTQPANTQSASSLSTGAIVGIAVGGALVGAAVVVLIIVIAKKAAAKRVESDFAAKRQKDAVEMQGQYRNVVM